MRFDTNTKVKITNKGIGLSIIGEGTPLLNIKPGTEGTILGSQEDPDYETPQYYFVRFELSPCFSLDLTIHKDYLK